jgi:hypothetical protein
LAKVGERERYAAMQRVDDAGSGRFGGKRLGGHGNCEKFGRRIQQPGARDPGDDGCGGGIAGHVTTEAGCLIAPRTLHIGEVEIHARTL